MVFAYIEFYLVGRNAAYNRTPPLHRRCRSDIAVPPLRYRRPTAPPPAHAAAPLHRRPLTTARQQKHRHQPSPYFTLLQGTSRELGVQ